MLVPLNVRIDSDLVKRVKKKAIDEDKNLQQMVGELLEQGLNEDVVVISGEAKYIYANGKDFEDGFSEFVNKKWKNPNPIMRKPQYAALYVSDKNSIGVILEIDQEKSDLEKGIMVSKGWPTPVYIPIRFEKNKLQNLQYTTFKNLITHKSTDYL